MSIHGNEKIGVVLMTYGSATTALHVREYFEAIYKGTAPEALIADFENRYRLIGHSPLIEITEMQSLLLEERLGDAYVVRSGMRHSAPSITDAVVACKAEGATKMIGCILSPQFSSFIMEGYKTAFMSAVKEAGIQNSSLVHPWPTEEHFVELLAIRTTDALEKIRTESGIDAPVIFTTHSMPKKIVENDADYLKQLGATVDAVRRKLPSGLEWYAGYQSAGHTPEQWLKPDLTEILAGLDARSVLIVPIQFLADHLEILYDLDIAARKQCESRGIAYNRIELPNTHPLFIETLATMVTNVA